MRITGKHEKLGDAEYFIPISMPPKGPAFCFSDEMIKIYGEAQYGLGQVNEMLGRLADLEILVKAYVIKEGVFSSAIEGVEVSLMDVLKAPFTKKVDEETQFVLNHILALDKTLTLRYKDGFPVIPQVVLSAHKVLLKKEKEQGADDSKNKKKRVFNDNLVAAPVSKIEPLIGDLERYIRQDDSLPALIKSGIAYAQFEMLHLCLDGSGRIGRLLILLMLIEAGLLRAPILYLSGYFMENQVEFNECLNRVRTHGDYEGWVYFYLKGIKASCEDAHKRTMAIEGLEKELRKTILTDKSFTHIKDQSLRALSVLFESPIINATELAKRIKKSYNAADNIISHFVDLKILKEIGTQKRKRVYQFTAYLKLLEKGF